MSLDRSKETFSCLMSFILGVLSVVFISASHATTGIISSSIISGSVSSGDVIYYPDDVADDFVVRIVTTEPGTFVAGFPLVSRKTCPQVSGRAVGVDAHTTDSETGHNTYDLRVNFSDTYVYFENPIRRFCIKFTPDADPTNISAVQVAEIALKSQYAVHPATPPSPFSSVQVGDLGLSGGGNVVYAPYFGDTADGHPVADGATVEIVTSEAADIYVTYPIDGTADCSELDSRYSRTVHIAQVPTSGVGTGVLVPLQYSSIINDDIPEGGRRFICVALSHAPSERTEHTTVIGYQVGTIERDPRPVITVTDIGATTDTTPDLTFNTTEAGTATFSGSCSSTPSTAVSAGDVTVTLSQLAEGTHSDCSITVTESRTGSSLSTSQTIPSFTVVSSGGAGGSSGVGGSNGAGGLNGVGGASGGGGASGESDDGDSGGAGNMGGTGGATPPASPVVTIAPIGTTADTTPDLTFTTDTAGTISYSGSCSSGTVAATVGSNTITLSALTLGTYSDCSLTITDGSGAATTTAISIFTIAPAGEVTPPPTPVVTITPIGVTTDTTPDLTFTSDMAGVITYSGSCSSSVTNVATGSNTVTLNTLNLGTYSNCSLTVTAGSGASTTAAISSFTVTSADTGGGSRSRSGGGGGGRSRSKGVSIRNTVNTDIEESSNDSLSERSFTNAGLPPDIAAILSQVLRSTDSEGSTRSNQEREEKIRRLNQMLELLLELLEAADNQEQQ